MADVDARYEFKSVRTMRGREARALAKWQKDGWELVTQCKGTLRTEMTFRRVKPKTIGTYFRKFASQSCAAFRRLDPKTQRRLLPVSGGLVLLIVGVGVVVGIRGGGGAFEPTASATKATTSPSEQPSEELSQEPGAVPVGPVRPTTTPAVSAPTPPVAGTALATVARLTVKGRAPKTGYTRAQFGQTWYDVDGNGCDTRNDILRRDLSSRQMKNACKVMAGTLATDPYTGTSIRFVYGRGRLGQPVQGRRGRSHLAAVLQGLPVYLRRQTGCRERQVRRVGHCGRAGCHDPCSACLPIHAPAGAGG
jgi:hypothetical protein